MAKSICYNTSCEFNKACGIVDVEVGSCASPEIYIGKSGFCLHASTISKDQLDQLEEDVDDNDAGNDDL